MRFSPFVFEDILLGVLVGRSKNKKLTARKRCQPLVQKVCSLVDDAETGKHFATPDCGIDAVVLTTCGPDGEACADDRWPEGQVGRDEEVAEEQDHQRDDHAHGRSDECRLTTQKSLAVQPVLGLCGDQGGDRCSRDGRDDDGEEVHVVVVLLLTVDVSNSARRLQLQWLSHRLDVADDLLRLRFKRV